jgi:DNA processing protein
LAYTEQEKYWIWMASMPVIGPKAFYYILKEFGDAGTFFDAVKTGSALENISADAARTARAYCSEQRVAEIVSELAAKGITAITRLSGEYPERLAGLQFPPPVLLVKGALSGVLDTKKPLDAISIVGTRRCTRKGFELARRIAKELAEAGVAVVSGMARGIDTAAHSGALEAGGKTIAVLGCGVDVIYPPESDDIYYKTVENGAVISELPPGTQPLAANFPVRNRIIAGLSKGTLVVESELEGGTAITASMAVALGRDVFGVPGPPYLNTASLSNLLIKQGACIACSAGDILEFYGLVGKKAPAADTETPTGHGWGVNAKHIQLDFLQRQIYNLLLQGDTSVESIALSIKYPQSEINSALTLMELGGLIKRLPGGKYGI